MPSSAPRALPQSLALPFAGADSHAHLDDERLLPQLADVLSRAALSGVSLIVHVFLTHERYAANARFILDTAAASCPAPDICFIRGLHPEDVPRADEEEWEHLVEAVRSDPLIRAIGEIGLDAHYEEGFSPSALQEPWFRRQLRLARELDKPVVIHSRDAWERTFQILDEEGMSGRPLLWHCFGGDAEQAARILDNGWHIALGGAATFKANAALREAARIIPLDRLMFETDCPYLAPMPWRGKLNEPAFTVFTAACIAGERGMDPAELWTAAGQNARRFFGM
ncbi:TatD family hydrolase [uncultured Mailhella sp.]|uniref:TatD family hydrolase n=1 Tax=uncultured Mailhella sp. TaxID=1981031 RepID=UPI00262C89D8|nr:TatD family hydrolase [uncultured Mailhella sp.]